MAVITITKDNFKSEVLESDKPVLLDFGNLVRSVPHGLSDRGRDLGGAQRH